MFNFFRNLFRGPALDAIVAVAVQRVKEDISKKRLSAEEKKLANKVLDTVATEIIKEIRD